MKAESIESPRILKVLQSFKLRPEGNCYIESGPINIALGLSDTHANNYEAATIILPSFERMALIDSGSKVHIRLESSNNRCWHILTRKQALSRLKLEGLVN